MFVQIVSGDVVTSAGTYITSENYPNDYVIGDSYGSFTNYDVNVHLDDGELISLTFEDFDLKRSTDKLQIHDTLSVPSYPKTYTKYIEPDTTNPLTLSGNKALIRLQTRACGPYDYRCDNVTGRGFKIKVGVGTSVIL